MIKIAFLFLTIGAAHHEQLWRNFFADHEDQYTIYAHAKQEIPTSSLLHPYRIPETCPTTWANTMRAQIALLKEALKDPDNDKFVFVSESTIPLATFDTVYQRLTATPHSIFMYRPNPHIIAGSITFDKTRDLQPIPHEQQYKSYQWVVLNRKHAQLMVEDTYYIAIAEKHRLDHERYRNAQYLANFIREHNLNLIGVSEKWLYHVPDRPYALTSENYLTISKEVVPSNDFDPIDEHWAQLGQLPHYDIQTSNFVLADGKVVIIDTDIHAMPTKPNGDYYPPRWKKP